MILFIDKWIYFNIALKQTVIHTFHFVFGKFSFEETVSNEIEVENGNIDNIIVYNEDSSNLISDINAKVATIIVEGLGAILNLGLKIIEGATR